MTKLSAVPTSAVLVDFRCQARGCGRLLDALTEQDARQIEARAFYSGVDRGDYVISYRVRSCTRHGATAAGFARRARRGGRASLAFGPVQVRSPLVWSLIDTARRKGHKVIHYV